MARSEWDALNGLKDGANCCSSNLPVYPENVRAKVKPGWTRIILVIIAVIISGVVGYGGMF